MKLLKNSTYQAMQKRIKILEKDLEDSLNELTNVRLSKNQMVRIIAKQHLEINLLKPKAEKWDAELKRQTLKSKIARIKKMSAKSLASKHIDFECEGLKGTGKICGYDGNDIVIGLENNKGWMKEACIGCIMKEYTSYTLVILDDAKESIINSLK